MKIVLHHPTGNANVRAAADGLLHADMLAGFSTSIATFPGGGLHYLSALSPLAELNRRRFNPALQTRTHTWPWREAGRLLATRAGLGRFTAHETGLFCLDSVYHSLDQHVAARLGRATPWQKAAAVYAYEDGAAYSFRRAKELGLRCFYDLPIGYWRAARRLLASEQERWPAWMPTLGGFLDSAAKLARKDDELRLADRILVASRFTADTLRDFPGPLAPIEVIPYGFPVVVEGRTYAGHQAGRPLKLLFVGGLSQRKGIADLFAVADALGPRVELTVVGHKTTADCPALDAALARHRWLPSLPHAEVLQLMQAHDVLVFPSLFEGFGLVITEAMSQGTPVITTNRTAGPDLIEHGHNGWLIEAGSTAALQAAIEELLHRPELLAQAGRAAQETARRRPWAVYGQELAQALAH
ncbi:MAG: glycosyltransferase [Hymenobacter sp.]|nr:MAG: glycosyltransferase [Hymenobacter sp.]